MQDYVNNSVMIAGACLILCLLLLLCVGAIMDMIEAEESE